jgi:putative ABC transport system permease protein
MTRRRSLKDLDDDIRDHLDRETQDNIDRGMTPEDARAAAHRKFGSVALIKEDTRAVWVPVWFDQLLQDARYALRTLRNGPGFSAVVILTLALGIGLNAGIFGLIDALLLRRLPVRNPQELIALTRIQGPKAARTFPIRKCAFWPSRTRSS